MHFRFPLARESYATDTESLTLADGSVILFLRVEAMHGREHLVDLDQVVHQAVRRAKDSWYALKCNMHTPLLIEMIKGYAKRYEIRDVANETNFAGDLDRDTVLIAFAHDAVLLNRLDALPASIYG